MKPLDASSPIPLYAQLAEAIRYEIATGAISPGDMLPPLRAAAKRWGVNLHTVRRAYGSLAEKGVVRTDPQVGTVVLGRPASSPTIDPVDWFVSRIVTEGYERHGLSVEELKLRLDRWGSRAGATTERPAFVIDRTEGEASALASQLRGRWAVGAEAWSIERPGPPPAATLIAPLQHYNDLRQRWPERVGEVHFMRTSPEGSVVARVLASPRPTIRVVVCEKEMPVATSIVADLRRILPSGRVEVMPHVVNRAGELLSFVPESLDSVLFPPRMWDQLSAAERSNPKAVPIRYQFDPRDAERLADDLGWGTR